jgi:cysteine desulfurase / selenocysteine lyase
MTAPSVALSTDFGPFHGRSWLNCAHQGPLSATAREAAHAAIGMKSDPSTLRDALFVEVPRQLRAALARLVGSTPEGIALTNSTSYGFNVLAQGLPWRRGDEILCIDGDFPATIVPWLPLQKNGVRVRILSWERSQPLESLLHGAITRGTRAVCVSWVFSFFGNAVDLDAVGRVCRERDVLLFVNASQAIGARSLNVAATQIDAVSSCGFKWLCGPYATGFCWIAPHILEHLDYPQPHWLRMQLMRAEQAGVDLNRELEYSLVSQTSAEAVDVFCAANFFNFMPWTAAIQQILEHGVDEIAAHDQALAQHLIENLPSNYELLSPPVLPERSTLVVVSHIDRKRNAEIAEYLRVHGVDIALRGDNLRFAPHLYNTARDVDRALDLLSVAARLRG